MSEREIEFNNLMTSLPRDFLKIYQESPIVCNVLRLCFENGLSKEEILINISIFLYHDNKKLEDLLIDRAKNRTAPAMFKEPTK